MSQNPELAALDAESDFKPEVPARLLRGLHYRRTEYKPGIGICYCRKCVALSRFGNRVGMPLRIGTPNPSCEYVNREQVFAEEWAKEHRFKDLAQHLMERPRRKGDRGEFSAFRHAVAFWLTYRERVILAQLIQWLGTNVGWCFLDRCIRRCGFKLVKVEDGSDA